MMLVPTAAAPRPLPDLPREELERVLVADGVPATHARTLWRALHHHLAAELAERDEFLPPLRRWVAEHVGADRRFSLEFPAEADAIASSDGLTRKFLLRLADGQTIETVVMGFKGRHTACLSTQAGCAMGCVFCATGQMGFVRHLRPAEIVAQVHHAQRALRAAGQDGLRNLVLTWAGSCLPRAAAARVAGLVLRRRAGPALP